MEINLGLEELFTNVVFYGYDDTWEHKITIDFTLLDDVNLQMRIEDDGKPFNLLERYVPDIFEKSLDERHIGGIGIKLIKGDMNRVGY